MAFDFSALLASLAPPTEPAAAAFGDRERNLERYRRETFDVAVIGAGINGCAIAAALAERGARVALLDRGDIAGETSMASGNAIWGGFKYLAGGHLRLVSRSCRQRDDLVRRLPHLVRHTEYVMPAYDEDPYGLWSRWLGARFYQLLGHLGATPTPRLYRTAAAVQRKDPRLLAAGLRGGIGYHEAELTTSDAHFTLQFALTALLYEAAVVTYAEVCAIEPEGDGVRLQVQDRLGGECCTLRAQRLVNAAGPWVEEVNALARLPQTPHTLALRRGTFLLARPQAVSAGDDPPPRHFLAYFCRGEDRPFFLYPWGPCWQIGTTDVPHDPAALATIQPSADEVQFMLAQVAARLQPGTLPLRDGILSTRCGVRPLAVRRDRQAKTTRQDALALSREHRLDQAGTPATCVVYGGKLTPVRVLATEVANLLHPRPRLPVLLSLYGAPFDWPLQRMLATARHSCEGVDLPDDDLVSSVAQFGCYSSHVVRMLREEPALAERPYPELPYTWADLVHHVRNRLVVRLDDLLRRRTNIAQWVPRGGFGVDDEHAATVSAMARLVCAVTGEDVDVELKRYRALVDERDAWRTTCNIPQPAANSR